MMNKRKKMPQNRDQTFFPIVFSKYFHQFDAQKDFQFVISSLCKQNPNNDLSERFAIKFVRVLWLMKGNY